MKNIFFTVLIILCSCTSSEKPDDLIPGEKMADLMIDIHLLEARVNSIKIEPKDSIQKVYEHLQEALFREKGISIDQYTRSFDWYLSNPDKYEKVYSIVVDSLMHRENLVK
ncbi:MAG: DUF4296 domain-containing protein [Bacteroidota bacterium]